MPKKYKINNFRDLVSESNLTLEEISNRSGVSASTIHHYTNDLPIENTNIRTLIMLSKALGCRVIDMITDESLKELIKSARFR